MCVICASFNRVEATIACLHSLFSSARESGVEVSVILVDSGSVDGTPSEVKRFFPGVHVVEVGDDHYWAKAMRVGWEHSVSIEKDYLLWLNDDVELFPSALSTLVWESSIIPGGAIVSGATVDPKTGEENYGGYSRGPWFARLRLRRVPHSADSREIDLCNGNVLFVPDSIDKSLGGFPKGFVHGLADLYFSVRAARLRFMLRIAGTVVGTCPTNNQIEAWEDKDKRFSERIRSLYSPKGLPFLPWLRLCFLAGGLMAPIYALAPLSSLLMSFVRARLRAWASLVR